MKRTVKLTLLILLIASVVMSFSGCLSILLASRSGNTGSHSNSHSSSYSKSSNGTSSKSEKQNTIPSGKHAEYDDRTVFIKSVEKSDGSGYDKPKQGKHFVIVEVSIENKGKTNFNYSNMDFKMMNSNKQLDYPCYSEINEDTKIQHGELAPGGKVEGTICYEEPVDDNKLYLQYEPLLDVNVETALFECKLK